MTKDTSPIVPDIEFVEGVTKTVTLVDTVHRIFYLPENVDTTTCPRNFTGVNNVGIEYSTKGSVSYVYDACPDCDSVAISNNPFSSRQEWPDRMWFINPDTTLTIPMDTSVHEDGSIALDTVKHKIILYRKDKWIDLDIDFADLKPLSK